MNLILADVVVVAHFAWVFYVLIGQFLIFLGIAFGWGWIRNFWFRFTHLSMMLLVAVETLFGIDCPLTVWERRLRGFAAGDEFNHAESDSFIARWIGRLFFFDNLDGGAWQFVVGYLTFTALVVWAFWKAPPRLPMTTASFVALVHAFVGSLLLATAWQQNWGVGVCFLVQAALWYGLQNR